MTKGYSGADADNITIDSIRRGDVTLEDVRIHPDTLEQQARVAEKNGNPQLAANFRRAAELTDLPDEEIMIMYEALRPQRSTAEELRSIATDLKSREAHLNAELFNQAADVYQRRELVKR
ncbi:MAG: propanediol dehydratase small subunit [Saprospiraceae bacterium]|jgi:propanediol dehydratase small subunit